MHQFTIEELRNALVLAKKGISAYHEKLCAIYHSNGQYQQEICCLEKNVQIGKEVGDKESVKKSHARMGDAFMKTGKYREAIECYCRYLDVSEGECDKVWVQRVYGSLANAYENIGQHEQAIECYKNQIKLSEELSDRRNVMEGYGSIANAYNHIGNLQKAVDFYGKQIKIAEELKDEASIGCVNGNMGNVYFNGGQYHEAINCFKNVLKIVEKFGDKANAGRAHCYIGMAYSALGEYQKAIECHGKHMEISSKINDEKGLGKAYGNLGYAYQAIGQYQKALDCHCNELKIAEEAGDKPAISAASTHMGIVYTDISQYKKAIDCHLKSLEISEEVGDERGVECAHGNLGNAYNKIHEYQTAIEQHLKQLEIAEKLGHKVGIGKANAGLGNAYTNLGELKNAIECHQKHLEIAKEFGDKSGTAKAYANLGHAYRMSGEDAKAIDCHSNHLQISEEIRDIHGVAMAQSNLGLCHKNNDDRLACSFFAKSILGFHEIRHTAIYQDEHNTSLSNTFAYEHKCLLECLLNLKQVNAALLVADGGKAKALYDLTKRSIDAQIDFTPKEKYTTPIQAISNNPCAMSTGEFLHTTLSNVIHLMQNGTIVSYTFDHQDDLNAWVISRDGVIHKKWQTTNGMSAKTYVKTVNNQLREILGQNTERNESLSPVIYNWRGNENRHQFLETEISGSGKAVDKKTEFVRDLEKRLEAFSTTNNAREKPRSGTKDLEIKGVKDKYNLDDSMRNNIPCLHRLPKVRKQNIEAETNFTGNYSLDRATVASVQSTKKPNHRGESSEVDARTEMYLKKKYSIFIAPIEEYLVGAKILIAPEGPLFKLPFCAFLNSKKEHFCDRFILQFTPALHVLDSNLSKPLPPLGPALFVGNPIVGEVLFGEQLLPVSPLPNAAVEATECSRYFNANPLLEENATKSHVLQDMNNASIVHIAAHGHIDYADIFLAPNEEAPSPPSEEHYLLTAKDVAKHTLHARLVVLSCCHSGRGPISAEGVVGIARSFLGAGARSVLVTLWPIPDKPTMEFMELFYERVCQGLSVCVALQQGMIELKTKYKMQAWAPFQIVGEDTVLTRQEIEEIRQHSITN